MSASTYANPSASPGTAIPSTLDFHPAPNGGKASQHQSVLQPTNGSSFQGGTSITIEFPAGRSGTYLNTSQSYLSGTYTMEAAGAAAGLFGALPRGGISSCIESVTTYSGSNMLSKTQNYAQIRSLFRDLQMNRSDQAGAVGIMEGIATAPVNDLRGSDVAAGASFKFTVPLFDPVVGSQARWFPLGKVHSLRMVIELSQPLDGIMDDRLGGGAANVNFRWTDVEFRAQIVELSAETEAKVERESGSSRSWSGTQHTVYTDSVPQAAAAGAHHNVNSIIPARFSSVKAIYSWLTPTAAKGSLVSQPVGRTKQLMTSYHYNLNGKRHPQKPVDTTGSGNNAMAECQRALHAYSSVNTHSSIGNGWLEDNDMNVGQFVVAAELESYSHRSDAIFSGVSTLAQPPSFECRLAAARPCALYHAVSYDCIYTVEGGNCTVLT